MIVYHGTFREPSPDMKPKFVSPSFRFAKWFASVAVEVGEPYWVMSFRFRFATKLIDADSFMGLKNPYSSWAEIEKSTSLKYFEHIGFSGVWMTEGKEPTIMLFEPEKLQLLGIEKFVL